MTTFISAEIAATANKLVGDCILVTVSGDVSSGFTDALTPDGTPNFTLTVTKTNGGYDATGALTNTSRTIYGTKVVRQADPNEAFLDVSVATNTTFRIALSETVYSGEVVTLTAASGYCTYGGGPLAAITAQSVTNNSTRTPGKVVAQWDFNAGICAAERLTTATFALACNARHAHGIACVKFTATGQTSAHSQTATVTAQTATQRSVTGLYGSAFRTTFPLAGFSQGEQITLRFQAYPKIGGASQVMDTEDRTDPNTDIDPGWVNGWTRIEATCDKNDALVVWALVDPFAVGGGTASATKATARADPFTTIKAAFDAGATNVLLVADSHEWGGNLAVARTTKWWQTVEPDTESGASATDAFVVLPLSPTTWGVNIDRLRFTCGIQARTSGGQFGFYGVNDSRWGLFDGAYFDANGRTTAPSSPFFYESGGCVMRNCTMENPYAFDPGSASSSYQAFYADGCVFEAPSTAMQFDAVSRAFACSVPDNFGFAAPPLANPWDPQNIMIECNGGLSLTDDVLIDFYEDLDACTHGMSIMGNLFERTVASSTPLVAIAGESDLASCENILFAHNTLVGQRTNIGYNEGVTQSQVVRGWIQHGNVFRSWNSKHDVFYGNGALTHAWAMIYGINFAHNLYEADAGFDGEYNGLAHLNENPDFVANKETSTSIGGDTPYGDGLGSAAGAYTNYAPDTGSPLLAVLPVQYQHLAADLLGTAFATVADIGAIQVTADSPPSPPVLGQTGKGNRNRDSRGRIR